MARRRRQNGRDINGILLLDKPVGLTSNAALQRVKRCYKANKAGHTGTLDPLASGLLPICLGEATKVSSFLLDADKRYMTTCQLGVITQTADAEGEVIETRSVGEISEEKIKAVLHRFTGEIEQVPPMHSAIKVNGTPLYKLAHQGLEVERKARKVTIFDIALVRFEGDQLEIDVRCSKGTYIRSLIQDIGEALGCGAHVSVLRRTASGPFTMDRTVSLDEIEHLAEDGLEELDELLLPTETAILNWPEVNLSQNTAYYLQQGQAVQVSQAPTEGWVRIHQEDGRFLGVGQVQDDGRVAPKRLIRSH